MTQPDWEAIESAYRAGLLSLREIATQHGISEGAIRKRAKRDEWVRDLSAKIKSKADDLVRKSEVRSQVRTEKALSERVLIDSNAEVVANVRLEHRGDIRRARRLTNLLFDELSQLCENKEQLQELGKLMFEPDKSGRDKYNELYHYIISFPERVKAVKALSESLKNFVGLEREAYNIGEIQKIELTGTNGTAISVEQSPMALLFKETDDE